MEFTVTVEGLSDLTKASERVRLSVASEINKAVYASGQKVATEAKKSILSGGKSGRLYRRRSVTHRASAPGEAPASDTGRLVNSIVAELSAPGEATVKAGSALVRYARLLEFGTRLMAARPFFFPAVESSRQWISNRIADALRRGIEQATR